MSILYCNACHCTQSDVGQKLVKPFSASDNTRLQKGRVVGFTTPSQTKGTTSILFLTHAGVVGWCDDAGVNFQCRSVLLIWIVVGQGPTVLAVGAGGLFGHVFSPLSFLFSFSLSPGDGLI